VYIVDCGKFCKLLKWFFIWPLPLLIAPPQLECVRIGGLPQEKTIKGFTVWFWLFFSDFYTFKNWWACLPPFLRGTSNTNNSILQVFCTFQLTYPTTTTRVCAAVCVWQANYHVLLYHFLNFTIITHTLNVLLVLVWLREHRCCCFVSHNNCNNVQL